jgi:hypothetical protein
LNERYWLEDSSGYRLRSHGVAAVADIFVHRSLGANRVLCQMVDVDADESSGEEWQESGSETQAVVDDPTQPASKKPEELKPLGKLKKGFNWKPVHCNDDLVHVIGGFSAEHLVAPSIPFPMGKVTYKFIELSKNATWFLKGVGGNGTKKGDLKAVTVLHELRKKYNEVAGVDTTIAVAEDQDENADDDIMNCLDDLATPVPVPVAKAKAKAKGKAKAKAKALPQQVRVESFKVPKHPACTGWKEDSPEGQIEIHMYKPQKDTYARYTLMYLRSDCIAWLLQYAADELLFQGVGREDGPQQNEEKLPCNCSEVADLHLEWDFTKKQWTATFVAGEHAGTIKSFSAADLKTRCKKMLALGIVEGQVENDVKRIIERFMIHWCQAIVGRTGDAFEQEWGLVVKEFETPKKKPRLKKSA